MKTNVVMIVALVLMVLSAGAALAQYGAAAADEQPFLRAKIGWFEPDEGDLDGDVAFGVDYVVPAQQAYLTIDRLHAENTNAETTAWNVIGGLYRTAMYGKQEVYYGAGIGWSSHKLETPAGERDDDNLVWEVGAGLMLSDTGFAEIKYRDGDEDGNTGLILYLGVSY